MSTRRLAHALGLLLTFVLALVTKSGLANPSDGLAPPPNGFDRTTPRAALREFLDAARAGDYLRAAYALDVRGLPTAHRPLVAADRARRLLVVLDRELRLDPAQISDESSGNPADGPLTDRLGEVAVRGGKSVPIHLARVESGAGPVWVFSRATVQAIPNPFEMRGIGWAEGLMPRVLNDTVVFGAAVWEWGVFVLAVPAAFLLSTLALWIASVISRRTRTTWDDELFARLRAPLRWLLVLMALASVVDWLGFVASTAMVLSRALVVLAILAGGSVLYRAVDFAAWFIEERARLQTDVEATPFAFRNVQTQVRVMKRVVQVVLLVVVVSVALLEFQSVRSIGVSLLASAGIVGVVIGLAAQKPVSALLAGIQVSLTRPVVIGDTVVFEGHQGTVEEIRLTYVVVKTWDERRFVIPMARLLDQPFENWTKVSSELLGTVFLRADLTVPMRELRAEVDRIVDGNELWDGRTKSVHVTELQERLAEIRVLLSARDAPTLWALRCLVREELMLWLAEREGGRYLPHVRLGRNPGASS